MTVQDLNQAVGPINVEDLEQYQLRGRQQIRHLLNELISARSLISVHLNPGGLSFLSTIVTLSEDQDWLFMDASPNETIHRRTLEATYMQCVTQLNRIRIQFKISNCRVVQIDSHPTLAAPVPEDILRLQRRVAFRLEFGISHELKCVLPVQGHRKGGNTEENKISAIEVPVIDISAGGLSIEIPMTKITPTVGDKINGCHLKLPDDLVGVNLEVRNHGRRIQSSGKEVLRLGCSFIGMPTSTANIIQRYIYQTERELSTMV